jgi:signal transduction histidine kinase
VLTVLLNVFPPIDPTIGNRRFHVAMETAAGMVLLFVAAVLAGRYRTDGSRRSMLVLAAVVVLVVDNLVSAALTATLDSIADGGFATWAVAGNSALGALLLAGAAASPPGPVVPRRDRRRRARTVSAAGVGLAAATTVVAAVLGDALPGALASPPEREEDLVLLGEHPALAVTEVLTALGYALAAVAFHRLSAQAGDMLLRWLAAACVVLAAAFVNYALFPSPFTELVYAGDLFFLVAVGTLLVGAVREVASAEAARVGSAVFEERRRMARDLHDGVAQELAFISAQSRWFADGPDGDGGIRLIRDAVDRALAETRSAIGVLSRPVDDELGSALTATAADVAHRAGARVRSDVVDGVEAPAASREALMRITREAVGNAVRHGGARTVTLHLRNHDGIRLRIADDGRGFDPRTAPSEHSFGLVSMRERAESLGGNFSVSSAPGGGTTVEVVLP